MLLGLRTAQYHVKAADLENVKAWYEKAIGVKAYFSQPFYVGFNVGGFELGLLPSQEEPIQGNSLAVYWGVADIQSGVNDLVASGATLDGSILDVGHGIKKATLIDPFGNKIGIIENPHFVK
jgi:predicted enzyme related to lactoylglutathione lyase